MFGDAMDPLARHEKAGATVPDANHSVIVSERQGVDPFDLDSMPMAGDGFGRDPYPIGGEWQGAQGAESALRRSQEELRRLSVQLLTVQESERQRIAADLHDGIGQSLSLIKLSLEQVLQARLAGRDQTAAEVLQQTIDKVKDAMNELRRTTSDLRPPMLDDLGIIPTMRWFFRELEAACRGTKIETDLGISESDVPVRLKATIFRILQEAMNNVVKHAKADLVRVRLRRSGALLKLSVEDNGQGFDRAGLLNRRTEQRSMGLLTMKERARASCGVFELLSARGAGTKIVITWHLKNDTDIEGNAAVTV